MRVFLLIASLLFLFAGAAQAADNAAAGNTQEEQELEAISVTATRLERKVSEVPASVTVIGEEKIKETKMFNLKEALTGTPGVLIDSPNQGYDSRLIIRGAGLKARYGVREIMVLLNGVPITDPDSFTRLDFVDTQLIQSVEVVKGPNSTMWGVNAAGGVINIITKSPFEQKGGSIKLGAGDFSTGNANLSYSTSIGENFYFSLSGSKRASDNSWRRWNEFWTDQVTFQPSILLNDGSTIENNFSYTKASLQLAGSLDEEMFEEYKDTGRARDTEGPWQFSGRYSEILSFSSKWTKEIGNFEFKPLVFATKWRHHHPVTGRINDADTKNFGTDIQMNYKHAIANIPGTLTGGATFRYDDQKTDYYQYADFLTTPQGRIIRVLSDNVGDFLEKEKREVFLWGLYLQESFNITDRWLVDVGVRYDQIDFDISGFRAGDYDWGSGGYIECPNDRIDCGNYGIDKSYDSISPRIGMTYRLTDHLNIFGTVGTGIQTPTEGEISDNPDLDLVTIQNYEAGLKYHSGKFTAESSVYYSPVEDEIVGIRQPDNVTEYVNAGETEKIGVEFAGSYAILPALKVGVNYAYSDYTFKEFSEEVRTGRTTVNVIRDGNRLPYIPEHQYSVFLNYRNPSGYKFSVQSHSWGSYFMDNANTERYGGYDFVTNAMVGYGTESFDIALNVDNIFNKKYAVEAQKDTSGEKTYKPAAPRSFIVRLTYYF